MDSKFRDSSNASIFLDITLPEPYHKEHIPTINELGLPKSAQNEVHVERFSQDRKPEGHDQEQAELELLAQNDVKHPFQARQDKEPDGRDDHYEKDNLTGQPQNPGQIRQLPRADHRRQDR